jgi:hypothetical protein
LTSRLGAPHVAPRSRLRGRGNLGGAQITVGTDEEGASRIARTIPRARVRIRTGCERAGPGPPRARKGRPGSVSAGAQLIPGRGGKQASQLVGCSRPGGRRARGRTLPSAGVERHPRGRSRLAPAGSRSLRLGGLASSSPPWSFAGRRSAHHLSSDRRRTRDSRAGTRRAASPWTP